MKFSTKQIAAEICLSLFVVLGACRKPKTDFATPMAFEDWSEEKRVELVFKYTLNYHASSLKQNAQLTGVPRPVLATMLSMERYNDWRLVGSMGGYAVGDLTVKLGRKPSIGPANISLLALQFIQEKKPGLFKYTTPDAEYERASQHEGTSIYWGAWYLRLIHDEVRGQPYTEPLKWVKAIGLYNEGLSKNANFVFGPYSRTVESILKLATEYFKESPTSLSLPK